MKPIEHVHLLVVEDNELVARVCKRILEGYGAVTLAVTAADARAALGTSRLTGLVTDISLPDGSGLDIAREARVTTKDLPILIISAGVDPSRLDIADEISASFLLKPLEIAQLMRFAERAIARQRRVATLLLAWMDRYKLSAAEMVVLRFAVDGLKRDGIAAARRVSPNTVKRQVGALLAKVGAATLAQAVTGFYAELAAMTW